MGNRRIIDSKIRASQSFAKLTHRQRDLWQGMIVTADDQGRMPGTPAYIRSVVWPYDDINLKEVENDLQTLVLAENIVIYFVGESGYIQIVNWWKYQQGQWAAPSDYPPPIGWQDRARYHGKGNQLITLSWDKPGGFQSTILYEVTRQDRREDSKQDSALSRRDVNDDVKGSDEAEDEDSGEDSAAAPAALLVTDRDAESLLLRVTKFSSIPPGEIKRLDQVIGFIQVYGLPKTEQALTTSFQTWVKTPRKNGTGNYSSINFGWVDRAQEVLAGYGAAITKDPMQMTHDEFIAYYQKKAEEETP
jgi:hypothetical protein